MTEYTKIILFRILTAFTLAGVIVGAAVLVMAARNIETRNPAEEDSEGLLTQSRAMTIVGDDVETSAEYREKLNYLINKAGQEEFKSEIFKYIDKDSTLSWLQDVMIALHYQADHFSSVKLTLHDDKLYIAPTRLIVHGRERLPPGSGVFIQTNNPLIKKLAGDPAFMKELLQFVYNTITDGQKKQDLILHYDAWHDQGLLSAAPGADYKKEIRQNIEVIHDFFQAPRLEYIALANGAGLSEIKLTIAHLAPLQFRDVIIKLGKAIEPVAVTLSKDGIVVCQNSIEKIEKTDTLALRCSLPSDEPIISQFIPAYTTVPFLYTMIKFDETRHNLEFTPARSIDISNIREIKFDIENVYSGKKIKDIAGVFVDESKLQAGLYKL